MRCICTFQVCRSVAKSVQAVQAVDHSLQDLRIWEAICCRAYLPTSPIGGAAASEVLSLGLDMFEMRSNLENTTKLFIIQYSVVEATWDYAKAVYTFICYKLNEIYKSNNKFSSKRVAVAAAMFYVNYINHQKMVMLNLRKSMRLQNAGGRLAFHACAFRSRYSAKPAITLN